MLVVLEINGVRMPYNILAFLKMIDEPLDLNGSSSIFVLIILCLCVKLLHIRLACI